MRLRAPTNQCAWHGDGAGRSPQGTTLDINVDPSFDVSRTRDVVGAVVGQSQSSFTGYFWSFNLTDVPVKAYGSIINTV